MDIEVFEKLAKFPFIYNSLKHDGLLLVQHRNCIKCKDFECYNYFLQSDNPKFICKNGYDNYGIRLNSSLFVFNGLISRNNKVISPDRRKARKEYIVKEEDVIKEIEILKSLEAYVNKKISENIDQNFSLFHDIKTTYNLVISSVQNYIQTHQGYKFEDKLKNCPQEIIDLYDSLELVNSQLGMIDIIINPQAILQGSKSPINLYKLFHKISQLFSNKFSNRIEKENKEIKRYVVGNKTIPDINCFESIELIPIILIDNAIKYSYQNSKIIINQDIIANHVETSVISYGPVVMDENIIKIFEKNVRGKNAEKFTNKGIGMGLWVANNILKHHNSVLIYSKEKEKNGIGFNKFTFRLKIE